MTDTAISPLRRRMIEDMTIRQFKASTEHTYVRFVKDFSIFFGRSPNKTAFEEFRRYQLHWILRGVSPCTINATMTALRFFLRITVRRFDIAERAHLLIGRAEALGERSEDPLLLFSGPHSFWVANTVVLNGDV